MPLSLVTSQSAFDTEAVVWRTQARRLWPTSVPFLHIRAVDGLFGVGTPAPIWHTCGSALPPSHDHQRGAPQVATHSTGAPVDRSEPPVTRGRGHKNDHPRSRADLGQAGPVLSVERPAVHRSVGRSCNRGSLTAGVADAALWSWPTGTSPTTTSGQSEARNMEALEVRIRAFVLGSGSHVPAQPEPYAGL